MDDFFRVPDDSPLTFQVNSTIKEAAALLAEYDAEPVKAKRQNAAYWLENMQHGKMPYNSADYKVRFLSSSPSFLFGKYFRS